MRPEDLLARLEAGYEYDPMYGHLCNERDQLKAENARLLDDNARLQEVVTDDELHIRKVLEENAELRERACNLFNAVFAKNNELIDLLCENEKLRELVRDYDKMLGLALADYRGFDAPLSDATHIALRTRMYNLGIEVTE